MDKKKIPAFFWVILILEYLFIFVYLLNYDLAWMNSEKFTVHQWILSNGPHWKTADWNKFLNINVIECNDFRLSRPLSNFIEVVDTKWRACLWNITTPHPAFSFQWPFMFILLPWLLYRTFINMRCFPAVAMTGVLVYIATAGFLGPLVMLFHPSKNLANFFGVLSMFFFSLAYRQLPSLPKGGGVYFAGFLSLFLGFISDETGVYMYLAALLLFHSVWLQLWKDKSYGVLASLLALPFLYLATIKFLLPYFHWLYTGVWIQLNGYDMFPSPVTFFLPNWNFLWLNTQFLFADHPHLLINYPQLAGYPWILVVQIIYVLAVLGVIFLFFKALSKKDASQKVYLKLVVMGILLMVGYCFFQTFQLSLNVKAWGIWWYGSLFSLIYIFTFVFFLQFVFSHYQWLSKWAVVLGLIFVLNGLVFSIYRIGAFKHQNLNRTAYSFMALFKGTVDPYQLYNFHHALERSGCKRMYAHLYWRKWKDLPEDVDPVKKDKCFSGPLASDFYFFTEENGYLPADLNDNQN